MHSQNHIEKIKSLLSKDDIKEAIKELLVLLNEKKAHNELILQSAALARIEKDFKRGVIDWIIVNRQKNRIIIAVLEIVDEFDNQEDQPSLQMDESLLNDKLEKLNQLLSTKIKPIKKDKTEILLETMDILYSESNIDLEKDDKISVFGKWMVIDKDKLKIENIDVSSLNNYALLSIIKFIKLIDQINNKDQNYVIIDFRYYQGKLIAEERHRSINSDKLSIPFEYQIENDEIIINLEWNDLKIKDLVFKIRKFEEEEIMILFEAEGLSFIIMKL